MPKGWFDSPQTDTKSIVTVFGEEVGLTDMERKTLSVTGMSCNGCEQNVENALRNVEGVTRVDADHEGDTVELVVDDDVADDDVEAAIEDAGYDMAA
jgi:copper chaperone